MNKLAKVTYLLNSGFAVEINEVLLVFDYYQDPAGVVSKLIEDKKEVYFFASHVHFDHFNREIGKFADKVTKYILSYDIKRHGLPMEKVICMEEYTSVALPGLQVQTFSSTDEGVCFAVTIQGCKIFHAGDFNWWHWKGDTPENIAFARNGFKKQIKFFQGKAYDLAFFPVDSRLEEFCDLGVQRFCEIVTVENLVTMHNVGGKPWVIPENPALQAIKEIWSPEKPGTSREFHL